MPVDTHATSFDGVNATSVAKTQGNDTEMAPVAKAPKPDRQREIDESVPLVQKRSFSASNVEYFNQHLSLADWRDVCTMQSVDNKLFGVRHLQVCLLFLAMLLCYTLRVNFSVAIVAMTDSASANPDYPEYDWDEDTIALLLSSFYWGTFIAQLPAAFMTQKCGPKPLLVASLFLTSLISIMMPLAARWGGWGLVVAFRVMSGLSQGFLVPCIHSLLGRWCPVEDRGTFSTCVYSGAQLGTVIALPLCGVLSVSGAGWPSCFYIFGSFGIAWSVLWFFLGSNSPDEHPFISKEERDFIQESIGVSSESIPKPPIPWKSLFTSLPMWAIVAGFCGFSLGYVTLLTELPTFMKYVLGFDLSKNGLLSALPYLAMFILNYVFSFSSSFINKRKLVSLTTSRKIFSTIGLWGPGLFLIGVSYASDATTAVILLIVTVGINSAIHVGFHVNHLDLAPNFAGPMMSLSNGMGNIMSLSAPLIVGAVVSDYTNASQWRTVFFISAGTYFVTNTFYMIFASAELQSWNEPAQTRPVEI